MRKRLTPSERHRQALARFGLFRQEANIAGPLARSCPAQHDPPIDPGIKKAAQQADQSQ